MHFFVDLSKVFNRVRHDTLTKNLACYGVKHKTLDLLKNHLSNRKQYVQLNDMTFIVRSISVRVPQGSIIGPLLFNILSNDILKAFTKFVFISYADDTTLNSTLDCFEQNVPEIQKAIVSELQKSSIIFKCCKIKFMPFYMSQKVVPEVSFTINNVIIEHIKVLIFLGPILDFGEERLFILASIHSSICLIL